MRKENNLIVELSTINYRLSTKGLTLIEVMIVVAILAVMSSTLFSLFQGSLFSQKRGTSKALVYSEARAALEMMSREIEKAMVDERKGIYWQISADTAKVKTDTQNGSDEFFFVAPVCQDSSKMDLAEVGYWLKYAPTAATPVVNTLMRHYVTSSANSYDFQFNDEGNPAPLDNYSDQVIGNVFSLEFAFWDGSSFVRPSDVGDIYWSNTALPRAIKITLVMEYEREKDIADTAIFTTVVNIPGSGQ